MVLLIYLGSAWPSACNIARSAWAFGKIVLAYSGGLDTSVILPWLKDRYPGVKLVAFAAELGQGDELKGIEDKAYKSGADEVVIKDLRQEFAENSAFPMLRAHAITRTIICWAPASPGRSSPSIRWKSPGKPAPMPSGTARPARATTRCASS
jgi:hypothetical protein